MTTPAPAFSHRVGVKIGGSPLPDDVATLLSSVLIEQSRNLPDVAVLRFADNDRIVLDKSHAALAKALEITLQDPEQQSTKTLFKGEITGLEIEHDAVSTSTVIRGYDKSHRLFRGAKVRAFKQVSISDVISTIVGEAGLTAGSVQAPSTVYEHLTQAGISNGAFLQQLARETGCECAVSDGKLDFKPPAEASGSAVAKLTYGQDLSELRAGITAADQIPDFEARAWDMVNKQAFTSTATREVKAVELGGTALNANDFGAAKVLVANIPHQTQGHVDSLVSAVNHRMSNAYGELVAAMHGNPLVVAGAIVEIAGAGDAFNGKYTVTSARHTLDADHGYRTRIVVSGQQERSLLGLTGGGVQDSRTRINGVVPALVTNLNDPDARGRVKVKMPWLDDQWESTWARVAMAGAGNNHGTMWLPEVNDEVLVAFEQGDINSPYVIGGLYNGQDHPKDGISTYVDSGTVKQRSLVTTSGHRLDLVDDSGKEKVQVLTGDTKFKVVLDQANTEITVHADGRVLIEGTQGITLDAGSSGNVEIKGSQIKLTAQQGADVDGGTGAVNVKSSAGGVTVDGGGGAATLKGLSASVQGNTTAELKGNAMVNIQGGMVKIN